MAQMASNIGQLLGIYGIGGSDNVLKMGNMTIILPNFSLLQNELRYELRYYSLISL